MFKKVDPLHLLLISLGVVFGVSLFNHGPVPSMEPRFAEAVREMLARGEYLVPIKNGIPYIEYPPLYFWLGMLAKVLGGTIGLQVPIEASIRLPAYAAFLTWVWWLGRLQKELFPSWSWPRWLLPLMGAAMPAILYNFFTAQSDSLLILGTLIAFSGFVRKRTDPHLRKFPWELWLGVALAVAAKGPVGFIITVPAMGLEILLAPFLSLQPDTGEPRGFKFRMGWVFREFWRMAPLRGILLASIGVAPWYLASGFTVGWDFVRAVLVYQNFTRFFVGFDHLQPWWMYAASIWGDMLPLSLLIPFGLFYGFRYVREFRWRVLLIWALFTVVFFSISASKQSKYILPAAPAFAMLALAAVELLFRTENLHRFVRKLVSGIAVFVMALFALGVFWWLPKHRETFNGSGGLEEIRAQVAKAPGDVVSFQWPRSLTLYILGGPMNYVRSSRELYQKIHDGVIRPGDYILVPERFLPVADQESDKFVPAPSKAAFDDVLNVTAEEPLRLYRVKPEAAGLPIPKTPEPAKLQWWQAFDTD